MATSRRRAKRAGKVSTADLCIRYARIYTAAITDVLDKRGYYNQTLLGAVPRDAVLVIQANDHVAAHFGELSAVTMKARGVRGVVVDGATRDAAYILRERFPLFCRYRTPLDSLPRWRAVEWGRPVTIGDVRVSPGDIVVGDLDGVAVVPVELALDVLLECEALLDTENQVRDAVRKGMAPLAAYEKFGVF
jgi:regulator of RNase E activity RraA